jgi:dolichol-phosphate mannosyltransferase
LLTILTPAFNEAANLSELYRRLATALADEPWEWIVVDDRSSDATFSVLLELARQDSRVRGVRLAHNVGAHLAVACGLQEARGDAAVVMACDLQDPPERIAELMLHWRNGAQVVWATRTRAPLFSRLYYVAMRHVAGIRAMPSMGADFLLMDSVVIEAVCRTREPIISIPALIMSMGFRHSEISCDKQSRQHGRSGWTTRKKIALAVDSLLAYSNRPLRVLRWTTALLRPLRCKLRKDQSRARYRIVERTDSVEPVIEAGSTR